MLNKNVIIAHKCKISPVIRFFVLTFTFKVKAAPFAAAKVNALHFLFALCPSFTAARRRVDQDDLLQAKTLIRTFLVQRSLRYWNP